MNQPVIAMPGPLTMGWMFMRMIFYLINTLDYIYRNLVIKNILMLFLTKLILEFFDKFTQDKVFKFIKTDPSPSILITFLSTANERPKPIDEAKPILPNI